MRKGLMVVIALGILSSCGQEHVVYVPLTEKQMAKRLASKGIDPCRVYPCRYAGKTEVETVKVPAEDKGDFIIFPHKEAVVVKPVDAVPPADKVEKGRCR